MIIGFGKVEDVYEEQVAEHFRRAAIKAMREGPGYIDDATENRLRKWLDTEGAESRKLADAHDIPIIITPPSPLRRRCGRRAMSVHLMTHRHSTMPA